MLGFTAVWHSAKVPLVSVSREHQCWANFSVGRGEAVRHTHATGCAQAGAGGSSVPAEATWVPGEAQSVHGHQGSLRPLSGAAVRGELHTPPSSGRPQRFLRTCHAESGVGAHVPFSTLREQGSSKWLLTLGQEACVLKVLTKAAAVPSTTPLMVRKSSACTLLKLPQRPGVGRVALVWGGRCQGSCQPGWAQARTEPPLTARQPSELGLQLHRHLHGGHQLHIQLQAQVGVSDDEEGGGPEDGDIGCGQRTGASAGGRAGHQAALVGVGGVSPAETGSWV